MKHTKYLILALSLTALVGCNKSKPVDETITIYYTNDIHSHVDNETNNFAKLKTLKDKTENALLFDAGDAYQGTAYGSVDKGQSVHKLMEEAGYDVGTFGNHDFDFKMDNALDIYNKSTFPIISCNFYKIENGVRKENVADSYKVFSFKDTKIGVVGIASPLTIINSTPKYFQDDNGNYIYGFSGSKNANDLYVDVQTAINTLKNVEHVDYVIALGHVGSEIDENGTPNSQAIVGNTSGIDVFIDGHSHTEMESLVVKDKDNKDVIITQTGNNFGHVGKLELNKLNNVKKTSLITLENEEEDANVKATNQQLLDKVQAMYSEEVAQSDIDFLVDVEIPESTSRQRIVRSRETNVADFTVDAYYWYGEQRDYIPDIAFSNAGGVRADIMKGVWTIQDILNVNPFGNSLCVCNVKGSSILEALEFSSIGIDGSDVTKENASLLQASGIKYTIDTSITSTVTVSEGNWVSGPTGDYRVKDVEVYDRASNSYVVLDMNKYYKVISIDYILINLGSGFTMFKDAEKVVTDLSLDYLTMVDYASSFPVANGETLPEIGATNSPILQKYTNFQLDYTDAYGCGRINII